jgi:outer membrane protein assembly factor BamB
MPPNKILLLGMKKRVTAVERATGRLLWETKLKGGQGDFVTLLCDGPRIYAACGGHLHCLDFATGEVQWTNELPGYGYGLASLCLPDGASAPTPAAMAAILAQQQAATTATTTNTVVTS